MSEKEPEITYVTRPFMPPLEEFVAYLQDIWESKWLTNMGKFHRELERALCDYLGVHHVSLFTNGTLALITALQALRITGEVITTPYSFVATTHALWWNGIKPVFVDIEPKYMNIDADKIEAAISPNTTAILPVHVYGNPCNLEKIQLIADTYGLNVIYDACHAFGVNLNGTSILNYGDLSILSFHATKVFTTFEGGAIVCHSEKAKKRIDFLKNFGFAGEVTVVAPGINAKMSEVQAAFGLVQLKHVKEAISKRKKIADLYKKRLTDEYGIRTLTDIPLVEHNYPYFPILINKEHFGFSRDEVYDGLKKHNIFCRRYFYPLISDLPVYQGLPSSSPENLPIAHQIAREVLCLPIFPDLPLDRVDEIASLLKQKNF